MLVAGEIQEQGDEEELVQDDIDDAVAQGADTAIEEDAAPELSIPSPTPPTSLPQQSHDLPSTSQVQHTPPQSPLPQSQPPPQAYPQAADFPMSLLHEALNACAALTRRLERGNKVKVLKLRRLKKVGTSQRIESSDDNEMEDASNQGRMEDVLMVDKEDKKKTDESIDAGDDQVKGRQADIYKIDMDHVSKVLSMQEDKPNVQEVVDVDTTAKLITEVVTAAKESTAKTPNDTKSKDKGKGIMVEEPKPMKKKQQVEIDKEYARKLHEELNQEIDWDVAIDHVKQKAKDDPYVKRYQHLEHDKVAQALEITKLKRRVKRLERGNKVKVLKLRRLKKVGTSQRIESSDDNEMEDASNQGRMEDVLMVDKEDKKKTDESMDAGDDQVKGRQADIYKIDMDHVSKVLSMQEDKPNVQEVVDVDTTAKLITEVVTAASTIIVAAEP
nr:hypothetical protein [Tanacetum cinerariifolium]